jgi:hypothetical protein
MFVRYMETAQCAHYCIEKVVGFRGSTCFLRSNVTVGCLLAPKEDLPQNVQRLRPYQLVWWSDHDSLRVAQPTG